MRYTSKFKKLAFLGSILLLSTSANALDADIILNGAGATQYIPAGPYNTDTITVGNGGILTLNQAAAVTFSGGGGGNFTINAGGKVIFELGTLAANRGNIQCVGPGHIVIQNGAIIEVNQLDPLAAFPITYNAAIQGSLNPAGDPRANITTNLNAPDTLNYTTPGGVDTLSFTMTRYTAYSPAVSSSNGIQTVQTIGISTRTIENHSTNHNDNVGTAGTKLATTGKLVCTKTNFSVFASDSRTLKSASDTLAGFLSGNQALRPTKYQQMAVVDGFTEPRANMKQIIKDGQLPSMQFKNPLLGMSVWIQGIHSHNKNTIGTSTSTSSTGGAQIGIDTTAPFPIGVSFSYSGTASKTDRVSNGHMKNFQTGLYGSYSVGDLYYVGSLSYNHSNNKMGKTTRSNYSTNGLSAYVLAGYTYQLTGYNVLEPLVSLSYGRNWTPSIKEYSNGALSNIVKAKVSNSVQSELGARISHFFDNGKKDTTPIKIHAQATWGHTYSSVQQTTSMIFANGDGSIVNVPGQRQPRESINLGTGVSAKLDDVVFTASYGASLARNCR